VFIQTQIYNPTILWFGRKYTTYVQYSKGVELLDLDTSDSRGAKIRKLGVVR
jgi:hypothetical protein